MQERLYYKWSSTRIDYLGVSWLRVKEEHLFTMTVVLQGFVLHRADDNCLRQVHDHLSIHIP